MTAVSVLLGQVLVTTQVNDARPAFEEATVAGLDPSMRNYDRRQLTTTTLLDRTDLLQLIFSAYLDADGAGACSMKIAMGHECPPIVGSVPAWMRTYKFEVAARFLSGGLPAEDIDRLRNFRFTSSPRKDVYPLSVRLMLQRLLEETFDLKVRRARRDIPVFAITARTNDLPPTMMYSTATATTGIGTNGLVFAKTVPGPPPYAVQLVFEGSTVQDATDFFSFYLDRPVVDRTGLDGEYNFTLEFKGNSRVPWLRGGLPVMAGFDAAQMAVAFDRLGFNVEATTAPFEVLVIDQVQRPSSTNPTPASEVGR